MKNAHNLLKNHTNHNMFLSLERPATSVFILFTYTTIQTFEVSKVFECF